MVRKAGAHPRTGRGAGGGENEKRRKSRTRKISGKALGGRGWGEGEDLKPNGREG